MKKRIVVLFLAGFLFLAPFSSAFWSLKGITGNVILEDEVSYPNTLSCSDSDGGIFSKVSGDVKYRRTIFGKTRTLKFSDSCRDKEKEDNILIEYYCENGKLKTNKIECENGCFEGACLGKSESIDEKQCFLSLTIKESKLNESTSFSLESVKPLYGDYSHLVSLYKEDSPKIQSSASRSGDQASLVLDGNSNTDWMVPSCPVRTSCRGNTIQDWVQLDLGDLQSLGGITITPAYITNGWDRYYLVVDVLASKDGFTWQTLIGSWEIPMNLSERTPQSKSFSAVQARFVSVKVISGGFYQTVIRNGVQINNRVGMGCCFLGGFGEIKVQTIGASNDGQEIKRVYSSEDRVPFVLQVRSAQQGAKGSLGMYALYSSRFGIAEYFSGNEPKGETIEFKEGVQNLIIPYNKTIQSFVIKDIENGKMTAFRAKPSDIRCERTCKVVGEMGLLGKELCCSSLTSVQDPENAEFFQCTQCGNRVCDALENKYNCAKDCTWSGG